MDAKAAGYLGFLALKKKYEASWQEQRVKYEENPLQCPKCGVPLAYEKRWNTYCSRSCARKVCNKNIDRHAASRKLKLAANPNYGMCPVCKGPTQKGYKYCVACIKENKHHQVRHKPLEECTSDKTRKKVLLRTRPHQCQQCGNTEWLGQPIALEMHHADGNPTNNTEDNLKLICPNCHAFSHHHKGRNRGNGRFARRQRYHEGKSS